jgi:hypothetical protein
MNSAQGLDLRRLKVFPLEQRRSLTRVEDILIDPDAPVPEAPEPVRATITECADRVRAARERGAAVMLIYGAHLLRNGAALLIERLLAGGWVTHLATNGAGTIHDWEYAWLGRSTESVEENVATGTFGTWEETGRNINLALLTGAARGEGYGTALGRFIAEDGTDIPSREDLVHYITTLPESPLSAARADLVRAVVQHGIPAGRYEIEHRWKQASILAAAFRHKVPMTVHPGIGYDIIANHPMFSGAAVGRAAEIDFRIFGSSVEQSLSCVHNLRLQEGRPLVQGHTVYVVDLQDGGGWDWSQGEPPKSNAAYYLRFCKSFSRMGGDMRYAQCDNALFVRLLHAALCGSG